MVGGGAEWWRAEDKDKGFNDLSPAQLVQSAGVPVLRSVCFVGPAPNSSPNALMLFNAQCVVIPPCHCRDARATRPTQRPTNITGLNEILQL